MSPKTINLHPITPAIQNSFSAATKPRIGKER